MKYLTVFTLILVFTLAAFGQEIEPRGFDAAPATTTTAASATPTQAEPAPEPAAPANDAVTALEGRVENLDNWTVSANDRFAAIDAKINSIEKTPAPEAPAAKPALPWYGWVLLGLLFFGDIALLFGSLRKKDVRNMIDVAIARADEALESDVDDKLRDLQAQLAEQGIKVDVVESKNNDDLDPKPEPRDRRGPGTGAATAFVLALLATGMIAHNASAECVISNITTGSVVVKEQKPADFSLQLKGCEKDATAIQAAASGVSFADVKSEKGKVVAKVTADASAQTGPSLLKVTFTDGSEVVSGKGVFALILDPQTATVRKDVIAAKAEARAAVAAAKALTGKVSAIDAAVASRPTNAEVTAMISPLQNRIAQLESQIGAIQNAQASTEERLAVLGKATDLLAAGQVALGNKRIGLFRRPLSPSVAASAGKIRQAVTLADLGQ